jgi:hypothetical protein
MLLSDIIGGASGEPAKTCGEPVEPEHPVTTTINTTTIDVNLKPDILYKTSGQNGLNHKQLDIPTTILDALI